MKGLHGLLLFGAGFLVGNVLFDKLKIPGLDVKPVSLPKADDSDDQGPGTSDETGAAAFAGKGPTEGDRCYTRRSGKAEMGTVGPHGRCVPNAQAGQAIGFVEDQGGYNIDTAYHGAFFG